MNPKQIRRILSSDALNHFAKVYGLKSQDLKQLKLHDGAANLVYRVRGQVPAFLRISYRIDRDLAMQKSELNFLSYLAERGYNCPRPIPSKNSELCEVFQIEEMQLRAALFAEQRGIHLYERQFRLPPGISLTQFWQQCGKSLGRLHALSYQYLSERAAQRFTWLDRHEQSLPWLFADSLEHQELLRDTINSLREVPADSGNYGLCHNDFNVGNILIDYESDVFELKTIDFDDCGYNYYMYDLACFWEMCTGWAINIAERPDWQSFMDRCYSTMLEEYHKHFSPGFDAVALLPTFFKAVHIENILEPLRELSYSDKALLPDAEVAYHLHCLKNDIPFLGLFSDIFESKHPFSISL